MTHRAFPDEAGIKVEFCQDIRELLEAADTIDMLPFVLQVLKVVRPLPIRQRTLDDRYKLSCEKLRQVLDRNLHIFHVGPRGGNAS